MPNCTHAEGRLDDCDKRPWLHPWWRTTCTSPRDDQSTTVCDDNAHIWGGVRGRACCMQDPPVLAQCHSGKPTERNVVLRPDAPDRVCTMYVLCVLWYVRRLQSAGAQPCCPIRTHDERAQAFLAILPDLPGVQTDRIQGPWDPRRTVGRGRRWEGKLALRHRRGAGRQQCSLH